MYRQRLEAHDLSIEQDTENVPGDGFYYVRHRGEQRGRFRTLAQATRLYNEIKATLKVETAPPAPLSVAEIRRREMDTRSNKSLIWDEEDFKRVDRKTSGKPKRR
jgi:hypothetical protein